MKFRNDINALRALAVIAVVLYHYQVPGCKGGYAGVDIFFVISGYLMSKIILSGFEKGNFSLKQFYAKRVRRIVPALLVLILFVLLAGNFFFFPEELKTLSKYAAGSTLFYSNILYYLQSGYFDTASKNNALLHTWSLSVEWQFYLLYPLLLLPLRKCYLKRIKLFKAIIITFIVLAMAATFWLSRKHQLFSFYFFPTRVWEMALGCWVVLYEKNAERELSLRFRNTIALLAYPLLFFSIIFFREKLVWPGIYTTIPVMATALILICQTNFTLLRNKAIQFTGKISYSLYLWHWPLYVFAISSGFLQLWHSLILIIPVSILSWLSYRLIESNQKIRSAPKLIVFACLLAGLAFLFSFFPANQFFIGKQVTRLSNYKNEHGKEITAQMRTGQCFLFSSSMYKEFSHAECLKISDTLENILLIGDSHAAHYSLSLRNKTKALGKNLLQATTSYCYPFLNPGGRDENASLVKYILNEFIPRNAGRIKLVIVSANWTDKQGYSDEELKQKITELLDYLHQYKLKVKIIGQTEIYSIPFPSIAAKKQLFPFTREANFLEEDAYQMNKFLQRFIPADGYIDVYNLPGTKRFANNTPYMFDRNHFTEFGASQVIDYAERKGLLAD